MRLNFSDFPRKAQLVLMMTSAAIPAAAIAAAGCEAPIMLRALLLPAGYALLAMLCLTLPGRVRPLAGVAGAVALTGVGIWALRAAERYAVLAVPPGCALMLLWGLPMAAWPREREIFPGWYAVGLTLHGIAQLLIHGARQTGQMDALLWARPALLACFALFLLLGMLSMNRLALSAAAQARQRVPAATRMQNRLIIVALLALSMLIAAAPGVARAVADASAALARLIVAVVSWLSRLLAAPSTSGGSSPGIVPDVGGALETAEPSWFALLMERVLLAFAFAAAIALALFCLRFALRRLGALLRALADYLSRFAAAAGEDYIDEITDTRGDGADRSILLRLRHRFDWTDDSGLSPGQRIRRRYLRLMLSHRDWREDRTARETLPGGAASLYERARYSDHEISEDEAARFTQEIKRI